MKICLTIATALALAVPVYLALRPGGADAAGRGVIAVRPIVPAVYADEGRDALDDEMLYGMAGRVTEGPDAEGRYLVETRYRNRARVHRDDLLVDSIAAEAWELAAGHVVAAPFADVTAEPGLRAYPPLLTLPRGALLAVTGEEGEYYRVRLADGATGHVRKAALRKSRNWREADEATNRKRVVEDALSYLGSPYRWGGKTPAGLDCSGLASMAYLLNGLAIYRNSRPQAGYPVAIMQVDAPAAGGHSRKSLARAKPGDLIYWRGHQAVYLGEGKFLHANATDYRVEINSLLRGDDGFWPELALPAAILAWGTAYPEEPGKLLVRSLAAFPDGEPRSYRFRARLEGYAPTRAVLYPEGVGEGKPALAVDNPGPMLFADPESERDRLPRYRYPASGLYRPAVRFANENGWLPAGTVIMSEVFVTPEPLAVE